MLMTNQANRGRILWVPGIREPQLAFFEVATGGSISAADAARSQAVLHGHGARGFAVSAAILRQGRRESALERSVLALRTGCAAQIWAELEVYCCCGTAALLQLFGFSL